MDQTPTKLEYHDNMWKLHSRATVRSVFQGEDGRRALILDSTIFHPQGGGQPSDTGFITIPDDPRFKFVVQDVRSRDDIVFHYGLLEDAEGCELDQKLDNGKEIHLHVDELRRCLHSRLHSAGHLLDICIQNVGLGHFQPGKAYHFPNGPFVEYIGSIQQNELQSKREELESNANALISRGGKVSAVVLPYEEAAKLCGGQLPDYIPKGSTPRIVKIGEYPGCPCGGTHVLDISDIKGIKVSQIRTKKGTTKVFYSITV
ncbi:hypothetical protein Nepgr_020626 [Nepenthes gracilis]|uniref:Alanyl-transfer RNA synthetases family profile domain-containing protein n=1 Tax=Nepenthes gracilis TaxID=150966 RepID=A0AAD3SVM3_NEPGR|nr:hypothetical protein Nepgr_020626 [Nepenthes gracilis]